jgi:hypothetical protein
MKQLLSAALIVVFAIACTKQGDVITPATSETPLNISATSKGSSGGGTQTTGLLSFIGGASRLIGGAADSIQVNFTQPAPAGGWIVTFTTSDPAVQLPASYAVPAGEYIIHVPLTSNVVTASKVVTITVKLNAESKSNTVKVFPLHYNFPAPQLQSPGNGTGVKNRIQLKFQWSDNVNAYYHDIQISDETTFSNPMLEVYLNDPIWAASYFNGLGRRYWRVRYIDASGTPGPWSEVRYFEVKS